MTAFFQFLSAFLDAPVISQILAIILIIVLILHNQTMTYRYTHRSLALDIHLPYTGGSHNRDAWCNLRQ